METKIVHWNEYKQSECLQFDFVLVHVIVHLFDNHCVFTHDAAQLHMMLTTVFYQWLHQLLFCFLVKNGDNKISIFSN